MFPINLIFPCFANNYISVIVQAENVLNAGLHFVLNTLLLLSFIFDVNEL